MIIRRSNLVKIFNVFFLFIIIFIALSIIVPNFFTIRNMDNLARQAAIPIILSVGMTLLILSGNFDLSSEGQVAGISMVIAVLIKNYNLDLNLAIIIAPLIGIIIGLFNGYLSTKIPSFIVTLGTLTITRGMGLIVNNNKTIARFPEELLKISRFEIMKVPILFIYTIIIVTIAIIISNKTVFGRQIFAIGSNRQAAISCGIQINRNIIKVFVINGFLCGICAILLMGIVNAAHPFAMQGESLNAVTAVIIGGTSLWGGSGSVIGSVTGASLITMISVIFNLIGITSAYKQVILGFILIAVVMFDYFRKRWE